MAATDLRPFIAELRTRLECGDVHVRQNLQARSIAFQSVGASGCQPARATRYRRLRTICS
jgi:hypothetical protein